MNNQPNINAFETLEIEMNKRFCQIAAAHVVASKFPTIRINPSETTPWMYDVTSLWPEFSYHHVPLNALVSRVSNLVTELESAHPEMLETLEESLQKLAEEQQQER